MSLLINDVAPNFNAKSTIGNIDFHQWMDESYTILFSHPKDFTPVCTTEFAVTAKLSREFDARSTKIIGVSVDATDDHHKWIKDIELVSDAHITFPIIDDTSLNVAKLYGMLPSDAFLPDGRTAQHSATVRTVFIIGPDKKIRLMLSYPMAVGRNFDEIIRALDSIQLTDRMPVATPANWLPGEDVIVTMSVSDEDAEQKFGTIDSKLPYLRYVGEPK